MSEALPVRGGGGWLLVGAASFSVSAVIDNPLGSSLAAVIGLLAIMLAMTRTRFIAVSAEALGGLLAVAVVLIGNTQVMGRFSVQPGSYSLWFPLALVTGLVVALSARIQMRTIAVLLALMTTIVGSLLVLIPNWGPTESSDVFHAHVAAGAAMKKGLNPYSDAVVFESGDPNRPDGTLVEGYPYPAPPLLGYGLIAGFTDPRVVSLVSWVAVALGLASLARRTTPTGAVALAVMVLLSTMPIWRVALFMSWTEPLSLALLGVSLLGISKRRRWGWYVLGIALASKQYLVFLAPAVLLYRSDGGSRPGWTAIGTAAAVGGAPAVFGIANYYEAVVGNALDIGFRPDTQSLNGAIGVLGGDWQIATWVVFPVILVLVVVFARMRILPGSIPAAGVAMLVVALLVTSAFPNYWLLAATLTGLSAVFVTHADTNLSDDRTRTGLSADLPAEH